MIFNPLLEHHKKSAIKELIIIKYMDIYRYSNRSKKDSVIVFVNESSGQIVVFNCSSLKKVKETMAEMVYSKVVNNTPKCANFFEALESLIKG
jgi:hypothetical protein